MGSAFIGSHPPKSTAQKTFDAAIAAGFTVAPEGIVLGIADSDRKAWGELLIHLNNEIEQLNLTPLDSIVIKDLSGGFHTVTVMRFKEIFSDLGNYYMSLWIAKESG